MPKSPRIPTSPAFVTTLFMLAAPAGGCADMQSFDPGEHRDALVPSGPLDPDPVIPAVPGPTDNIDIAPPTDPDMLSFAQSLITQDDIPVFSFLNEQQSADTVVRFESEGDRWDGVLLGRVIPFDSAQAIDPNITDYTAAYVIDSGRADRPGSDPHEGIQLFQFSARDRVTGQLLGIYAPTPEHHRDPSDPVYKVVKQQAVPVADMHWPANMPAIHLPNLIDCESNITANENTGESERDAIVRSWGMTHHHAWRAWQMMNILESLGSHVGGKWQTGWVEDDGPDNWSMREWFGDYNSAYYAALDVEIRQLWQRVRTGVYDGLSLNLKCEKLYHTGNVCLSFSPVAHHWVKGYVNVCRDWYDWTADYFAERSISHRRSFILVHELMHHSYVTIGNSIAKAVIDTHTHGHGNNCLSNVQTQNFAHYEDRIEHLSATAACKHQKKNLRSPSSYAFFVSKLGAAIWDGDLTSFPPQSGMQPGIGDGCDAYESIENDLECPKGQTCGGWPLVLPELCIQANAQNEGP